MRTSRTQRSIVLIVGAILLSAAASTAAASYIPFNWNLVTSVTDTGGSPVLVDSEHITSVPSPFQHTSFASVGPHWAEAQYDFVFQPELNLGTFNTDVALHVSPDNNINSSNSGRFRITPDVDLPIHIDASLNYATPSTPVVDVTLRFLVFDVANPMPPPLFSGGGSGGTLGLNPAVGTLSTGGDRTLLSGHTYQILWEASIRTVTQPLPGGPSSASGYINFSFVPEPAALGSLGFAVLLLRRPVRRSTHSLRSI